MEYQVNKNMYFQHLLLFVFNRDGKIAKQRKLVEKFEMFMEMIPSQIKWWFSCFRKGNSDLNNGRLCDRHATLDKDPLNKLLC